MTRGACWRWWGRKGAIEKAREEGAIRKVENQVDFCCQEGRFSGLPVGCQGVGLTWERDLQKGAWIWESGVLSVTLDNSECLFNYK